MFNLTPNPPKVFIQCLGRVWHTKWKP